MVPPGWGQEQSDSGPDSERAFLRSPAEWSVVRGLYQEAITLDFRQFDLFHENRLLGDTAKAM